MKNHYEEVDHLIKKLEVNKKARELRDNSETLLTYWNIGRLIVEAQGGEERAQYGNYIIKDWSDKLTNEYGKSYDESNLRRFRAFYLLFKICATLSHELTWSHYKEIIPIKEENKRNYYINLVMQSNLGVRELRQVIKNNTYERLLVKPEKVELIHKDYKKYDIRENLKNPIIINIDDKEFVKNEKDLQVVLLAKLQNFFSELGNGFALVGNEYKIKYGNSNYYIDLLLFNVELNAYAVVELKTRKLQKEDKAQIEFYMNIVDNTLKREFHNKTIGIIVSKEQDKYIVSFVSDENVIPITYKLIPTNYQQNKMIY